MSKLPIKIESILQSIALAMVVFSLTGFFYVKIFYESFSIEVSNYFLLSDYLSISVTKIYSIMLFLLFLTLYILFNDFLYKKDIKDGVNFEVKSFRIFSIIEFILIVCLMLYFTIQSYLKNYSTFYIELCMLLFLIFFVITLYFGKKYSIKNLYMITIIVLTGLVFVFYGTTKSDAELLKKSTNTNAVVRLENNKNNAYLLIGVNSNYVFLYDKNQSKSFIFPKDKIEYIEIKD